MRFPLLRKPQLGSHLCLQGRSSGQPQSIVTKILDATTETIVENVANGEKITLVGFGTFEARERKERQGKNPQTGEPLTIPATTIPAFSAGKAFKEKVKP